MVTYLFHKYWAIVSKASPEVSVKGQLKIREVKRDYGVCGGRGLGAPENG